MSTHFKTLTVDDHYCYVCSSTSTITDNKRLSCFSCDHCRVSMCYDCFKNHTAQLIEEHSQLKKHYLQLADTFNSKQQLFEMLEEHCIRSVNSTFDEVLNDLQTLRQESIDYVKRRFSESQVGVFFFNKTNRRMMREKHFQIVISDMFERVKSLVDKTDENWVRDGITTNGILNLDIQRRQIREMEQHLNTLCVPNLELKMSTYPRNKLALYCQLPLNSHISEIQFSPTSPSKIISTKCSYVRPTEYEKEKIDVDTEFEELNQDMHATKEMQTDLIMDYHINNNDNDKGDDDEFFSLQDDTNDLSNRIHTEYCLNKCHISHSTILTQNEVDRIASDGEHLFYFSDTSKLVGYIINITSDKQTNRTFRTKEITYRWSHYPIVDLIYSPVSSQFVCATKNGIYTCSIDSNNDNTIIDIQLQLMADWSYVRLSADKDFLWIWTDTPRLSQLSAYSPTTFDRIKLFNLNEYPHFSDNSTSFCMHQNLIATVFQFKHTTNTETHQKSFHVTFCDIIDLHELCTIYLGGCDFDHEIRANNDEMFFITNGKRKLWIVDCYGKTRYVKLHQPGRALTPHTTNQILIANGTQQLQRIEFVQSNSSNI